VSESQRPSLGLAADSRVHLVPNGVDLGRFRAVRGSAARGRPLVVGRLSRLTPDKMPRDWIRTAASYAIPNLRFVIAGGGPLLEQLRQQIGSLNVGDRFQVPGYVSRSQVPALLRTFDVFCYVTSTAVESHPLVLLESLAAGVPIVAEARGGIPAIVIHGVNGLLASTPEEIEPLLRDVCENVGLRSRLAAGARSTAKAFSVSRQLDGYRRLLVTIAGERSGRRLGHLGQPVLCAQSRSAQLATAGIRKLSARERAADLHERFSVPEFQKRRVTQVAKP
jgi:glycosyltransferase involved in cell wall biosynthesis